MTVSWRILPSLALGAALLLPGAAAALDQAELTELEELLRDLGFNPGAIDGVVDADTIEAIRQYQDFAVLPGEPEPSEKLLDELRGVAAAFAALSAGKTDAGTGAVTGSAVPDLGAGTPRPETAPPPDAGESEPQAVAEKVIVPPPPAPPKLKPPEAPAETPPPEAAVPPEPEPPAEPEAAPEATPPAPPQQAALPEAPAAVPEPAPAEAEEPDPEAEARARIEAELAPFRQDLESGALTRAELARRFNDEGRQALQLSRFDEAIGKFSVAIHLDPKFAGAYSNRGTAYQKADQPDLAAADFAKARELGFGGLRLRDGSRPFN